MNDHLYLVGGTILILFALGMLFKSVRHVGSAVSQRLRLAIINIVNITLILAVITFFVIAIPYIGYYKIQQIPFLQEHIKDILQIFAICIGIFIALTIIASGWTWITSNPMDIWHEVPEGRQANLYYWSKTSRFLSGLGGPIVWLGTVVKFDTTPFTSQVPQKSDREAYENDEGSEALKKKGLGYKVMVRYQDTNAPVYLRMKIVGSVFDTYLLSKFLGLGEESEEVTFNDGSGYLTDFEKTCVIGPFLQGIQKALSRCSLEDIYPQKSADRGVINPQTPNHDFIPGHEIDEILGAINELAEPHGVRYTKIFIEDLKLDDATEKALTGGVDEIGQRKKEKAEMRTYQELLEDYLVTINMDRKTYSELPQSQKDNIRAAIKESQDEITAKDAADVSLKTSLIGVANKAVDAFAAPLAAWLGSKIATNPSTSTPSSTPTEQTLTQPKDSLPSQQVKPEPQQQKPQAGPQKPKLWYPPTKKPKQGEN